MKDNSLKVRIKRALTKSFRLLSPQKAILKSQHSKNIKEEAITSVVNSDSTKNLMFQSNLNSNDILNTHFSNYYKKHEGKINRNNFRIQFKAY